MNKEAGGLMIETMELADDHVERLLRRLSARQPPTNVVLRRTEDRVVTFDDKVPPVSKPGVYLKRTNRAEPQSAKRQKRKAQREARRKNR